MQAYTPSAAANAAEEPRLVPTADQVTSEVAPSRTGTPTTPLAKKEKVNSAQ